MHEQLLKLSFERLWYYIKTIIYHSKVYILTSYVSVMIWAYYSHDIVFNLILSHVLRRPHMRLEPNHTHIYSQSGHGYFQCVIYICTIAYPHSYSVPPRTLSRRMLFSPESSSRLLTGGWGCPGFGLPDPFYTSRLVWSFRETIDERFFFFNEWFIQHWWIYRWTWTALILKIAKQS